MADKEASNKRKVNNSLDMLRRQVNDLYTSTYYTRDNSEEMKAQVSDRLDDAIRKSTQGDEEFQNISNTSKLFRKLLKTDGVSPATKLSKEFGKGGDNDLSFFAIRKDFAGLRVNDLNINIIIPVKIY